MSDRIIVGLSIKEESLEHLLAGPYCTRICLTPDPEKPGVYRIGVLGAGNDFLEGMLRAVSELARHTPGLPPFPDPPPAPADVEGYADEWRAYLRQAP